MAPNVGDTVVLTGGSHRRFNDDDELEAVFAADPSDAMEDRDDFAGSELEIRDEAELTALAGKVRPVAGPGGGGSPRPTVTAEHSYRGLPLASEAALLAAIEGDLDPDALDGVEPSAESGYGAAQVRDAVESDGGEDGDGGE